MSEKIRIGYNEDGSPLHYVEDGHLTVTGPTRSGKFTDLLAGLALTYRSSLILIDPKGQAAAVTKRRRKQMGQRVLVMNPFNILSDRLGHSVSFNPLTAYNPRSPGFVADCDGIAEGLVAHAMRGDEHWTDSARQVISGIIMHLLTSPLVPPEKRNLPFMREVLTKDIFDVAKQAMQSGNEQVKERLARFAEPKANESRELNAILSVANTQTAFLGIEAIAKSLATGRNGSAFEFRDLKKTPTTVYLVLPTEYIGPAGKWFRLVMASAIKALLQEPREGEDTSVLCVMDEFANVVGQLSIIESAMSLAAGYGLQLMPILQDLNQLQKHYEKSWESFLANSDAHIYYAPRDATTAEYVAKLAGQKEIRVASESMNEPTVAGRGGGGSGISWSRDVVPELYLHDVLRVPRHEFLCFNDGLMKYFQRRPYYCRDAQGNGLPVGHAPTKTCSEFHGMYDPDPYYRPRKI